MPGDYDKRLKTSEAKQAFIDLLRQNHLQADILRAIGRTENTYRDWREFDPDFKARVDEIRASRARGKPKEVPDFPEFCEKYLFMPLYTHQLQWFDLLEGREPRDLHPSQVFEKGDPNFLLVNTPPEHSKTTTLSVAYATWQVVKNPNIKILFVSKTQTMAKQIMWAVKNRLTHETYMQLQLDFGPPGGWRADADKWASDEVYLGAERVTRDKDPTLRAVGIGGQVYGSRIDLMLLDDTVNLANAHEFEKQILWVTQEVLTRGNPMSRLLVIGTRVAPTDLYSELRNPERYITGESHWTYLSQPAILEIAEDPSDWKTLWPRAQEPWPGAPDIPGEDGLFPRWDGRYLNQRRNKMPPRTWALTYMQATVAEDSTFREEAVRKCINGRRQPGLMVKGAMGHRPDGMDGLYVIGSMDPAMTGHTGVVVMGVDKLTKKRYILTVINHARATPHWIRQTIKELTDQYKIHEWRIEKNAMQAFLTQDPELLEHLGALGVRIHEHYTGKNKWDQDYGVASMAPVLENGLMELPATHHVEACKQLVEQLITWAPETKGKTDLVMALWFADVRAREIVTANSATKNQTSFVKNRYANRRARNSQVVVNLNDLAISMRG